MTSRNSILLIVKQFPGIEYNALLNKIASNYSSLNSSRAALSRTLKDANAFGLIHRKGSQIFLTEKGIQLLGTEMKSKLLLKLNQLVHSKNNHLQVDQIIENIHTLIEHSKKDSDLLKAARASVDFSLSDLAKLNKKIQEQARHYTYLSTILSEQSSALQAMDFNDEHKLILDSSSIQLLDSFPQKLSLTEFSILANDLSMMEKLASELNQKSKGSTLSIPSSELQKTLKWIQGNALLSEFTLYFSMMKIKLHANQMVISGPHSKLQELMNSEKKG